jgi:type IV secretory pathway TrbL component
MTATLRTVDRPCVAPIAEPLHYATGANSQIAEATQVLLSALNAAVAEAARLGTTDTGAQRAAAALVDARIAMHQAITAAGRALADREGTVEVPEAGRPTAAAA